MRPLICFKSIILLSILSLVVINYLNAQKIDTVSVNVGWNLISLSLHVNDEKKAILFPTAVSDAYIYRGSYLSKDTLNHGYGFWLKFDSADTFQIIGNIVRNDTVNVYKGWNLLGSLYSNIRVDSIKSIPNNIILSNYFRFIQGGYQEVDTIYHGLGYWIKVNEDGLLVLKGNIPPDTPIVKYPADNSINIDTNVTLSWSCTDTDVNLLKYDVYFGYDNPPLVMIASNQPDTFMVISSLGQTTNYYWRIVARDNNGDTTSSPIWRFTTFLNSCPGETTVAYEGKTYNTVQISNQCWLKENLNVGMLIQVSDTAKNNGIIEKYCYNNDTINCNIYGGLYQWDEAMQYTTTEGFRGICPAGWHIPSHAEFQECSTAVGGNSKLLKAVGHGTAGGIGTNTTGFSALLSGARRNDGNFVNLQVDEVYWTSKESETIFSYYVNLFDYYNNIYINQATKNHGFSIRCLKDNDPPNQPSNPYPYDSATAQPQSVMLKWTCSDPDGDSIKYDIYFGTDNPPMTVISSYQKDTFLVKHGLGLNLTYYWKVIARDYYGDTSVGPIWSFTTASIVLGVPCVGDTTVFYEGKTYYTVQIDNQCWLRENLDVGTRINGSRDQSDNGIVERYCYNDNLANCNVYGGLYQWDEAMQYTTTPGARGICPAGWHIPTFGELQTLRDTLGGDGETLKAVGQGTATNTSGFSALLAGYRGAGNFDELLVSGSFWTSSEFSSMDAYGMGLTGGSSIYLVHRDKYYGFSIRCLKD